MILSLMPTVVFATDEETVVAKIGDVEYTNGFKTKSTGNSITVVVEDTNVAGLTAKVGDSSLSVTDETDVSGGKQFTVSVPMTNGATKTVTGSNFLVEAAGKKFLVDCGMYQGRMAEEMGEKRKRKERERRVTLLIPLSKAKVTKNFSKIKKYFFKSKISY